MKKIILIALVMMGLCLPAIANQKRFCHIYMVHGKSTLTCKTIKIHKKVEGKPIPRKSVK